MRKIRFFYILILSLGLMLNGCAYSKSVSIANVPESIQYSGNHPANNRQHKASVWLGCDTEKLHFLIHSVNFHSNQTDYHLQLSVFEGCKARTLQSLKKDGNIHILGFVNGYLYYWEDRGYRTEDILYCYNMEYKTESMLYQGERNGHKSIYFSNDGSAYFPLDAVHGETPQFVHVLEDKVISVEPLAEGYKLGERTYSLVSEYGDAVERILCTDENGRQEEVPLGFAYTRSIIPCDGGILIHNEGSTNLLYWIDAEGNLKELFSVPCMSSVSAVNICGTNVYLSFLRYEKWGDFGRLRYENDTLEGTYRISLTDYSVEKMNDWIFNGIYNFDDTCLYCCDEEGNIFKMGIDGTVVPLLVAQ